jgi:phosphopantothenoylcysteine decarboxylase/phosphopantothenate--cysteine ligase
MEEPDTIVRIIESFFERQGTLSNKKILITAGPTYEKLDPVRYISNYSSGKMGFALAEVCAGRGAEVILISGPVQLKTHHPRIRRIDVESATEMHKEALTCFPETDAAILCAAVADYKPALFSENKLKRNDGETRVLDLVTNPDIAASLGEIKGKNQILCGFALETDNELSNAKEKLKRKNLDFIVLNSLKDKDAGFQKDTNKISIIADDGKTTDFPVKSKKEVAEDIVNIILHSK